ncbi:cytochrome c class I [Pontibacter diazotrophicus]|uniref:Cytochrome c class I n=1 Tax=Pontibacter diazotrophicus TaxID=1400979 RepID=A0A3D8LG55_9BACT|nr:c-type cytochrome [Pontibacter diazotrophicus]RDV16385.1 cytochrome c class I [Pontibacter diazotrophicus]
MKKIWMVASCFAFLAACSNPENAENAEYESYYDRESTAEAPVYADSANEAELSASTRQSEVDTNLNNIGTDRTPTTTGTGATTGDAQAGAGAGAAARENTAASTAATQENFERGKNLIATSDCLACHQVDARLVGPSYEEVAEKYEFNDKNVNYLAGKIIEGGAGVWGQIPMSPHPDLSREDASEMAKYVLSLKK